MTRVAWRQGAAVLALAGIVLASFVFAAGAASGGRSFLVKAGEGHRPGWVFGPLDGLGPHLSSGRVNVLVLGLFGCYLIAVLWARRLRSTWVAVAIVATHAIFLVGPPIVSVDVFGYLGYARLGVLHGLSPYEHGVGAVPGDPINAFFPLHEVRTPYGPLWTLATYSLAHLPLWAGVWILKVVSVAASLGCVALVVKCVRALGRDPLPAAVLVGLNPVNLVYGVGGAHNDAVATVLMMAGVYATLRARPGPAAVGLVAGAFVKVTAVVAAPFAAIGTSRRNRATLALLSALAVGTALSFALLGGGLTGYPSALRAQSEILYPASVVGQLRELGAPDLRTVANVIFVAIAAGLLVRAWRGANWVACAAWAMVAFVLTRGFFAPWYMIGVLALTAVAGGRVLWAVAAALTGFCVLLALGLLLT